MVTLMASPPIPATRHNAGNQRLRGLTGSMLAAEVLDRHAGLGFDFAQEADDLFYEKELLRIQSQPLRTGIQTAPLLNPGGTSPFHLTQFPRQGIWVREPTRLD